MQENSDWFTGALLLFATVCVIFIGFFALYSFYRRRDKFVLAWSELRERYRPGEIRQTNNPRPRPLFLLVFGSLSSVLGVWLLWWWLFRWL